jgi:hypothetical protein
VAPTPYAGQYVYCRLDDSYKWADLMLVDVEVVYFDEGAGSFRIEYDGSDTNAPFNGAYTASKTAATLTNSGQWKTAKFRLSDSRFLNSQNGGADFRIAVQASGLRVQKITMTRLGQPAEAGALLRGWQQDFAEPLGTNFVTSGNSNAFVQAQGMLRVGPSKPGQSLLMSTACQVGTEPVEILTRVRLLSPSPTATWLGGVTPVTDPAAGNGYAALFRRDLGGQTSFGLISSLEEGGPFAPLAWQTNKWYWLRLRHALNTLSGNPDLWTRLWLADGETSEPVAWTTWRDYFPAGNAVSGLAGFVAGEGTFETDWLLIKADALPEIVAQPPARKPALPLLTPLSYSMTEGFRLSLRGDPGTAYVVEATQDFRTWDGSVLNTDPSGQALYQDSLPQAQRFYRAKPY